MATHAWPCYPKRVFDLRERVLLRADFDRRTAFGPSSGFTSSSDRADIDAFSFKRSD